MSMSGLDDNQNRSRDASVYLDARTSLEQSFEDPGTPSSHGLPKDARRTRKHKNSDEDFQP